MTCEMLEDLGYQVTACSNGKEAIAAYRTCWQQIDMALIDMTMPEMDGQETYLELRNINPDIPAILCSGYSLNGNVQNFLKCGFRDFICKPFSSRALSEKISKILKNGSSG
jgi:CheY-like chemotaxis protein